MPAAAGRAALWCRGGEAAARALEELAGEARRLLCGLRFAVPGRLLKLISRDKKASRIFSKYIPLTPRAAALSFLNALLQLIFSQPVMHSGATPVYLVPPCHVKFKSWR